MGTTWNVRYFLKTSSLYTRQRGKKQAMIPIIGLNRDAKPSTGALKTMTAQQRAMQKILVPYLMIVRLILSIGTIRSSMLTAMPQQESRKLRNIAKYAVTMAKILSRRLKTFTNEPSISFAAMAKEEILA